MTERRPGRPAARIGLSALEWRLALTAVLASVYLLVWWAVAPPQRVAPQALAPVAPPLQAAPAVRTLPPRTQVRPRPARTVTPQAPARVRQAPAGPRPARRVQPRRIRTRSS